MYEYSKSELYLTEELTNALNTTSDLVAVIRSIDSSRATSDLSKIMDFHHIQYELIYGNVCVFKNELLKAIDKNLFSGFDELWLFKKPPLNCLSTLPYSTGDSLYNRITVDPKIQNVFEKEQCILLLADGVDVHYLLRSQLNES